MTDKEILIRVIKKAISNGCSYNTIEITTEEWIKHKFYYSVIFDHNFAKAFWGEELIINIGFKVINLPRWKVALQQLVQEEEPLKYLEKFL